MIDRELYQQLILEHNKSPKNKGVLDHFTHSNTTYNPFCGDEIHVTLDVEEKRIKDIKHKGYGCSISVASASLMTEVLKGKSLEEVEHLFTEFQKLVKHEIGEEESSSLGKLAVFSGIWNYPARVKCALLPWHALRYALEGKKDLVMGEK